MKCPGCDRELEKREHAQPMVVHGIRCWPSSFCDACCKAGLWAGGSAEALERLSTRTLDPTESARVTVATEAWRLPFADLVAPAP